MPSLLIRDPRAHCDGLRRITSGMADGRAPMKHDLIDEFHLLLTPVAIGTGQHLFEDTTPHLNLADMTRLHQRSR